MLFSLALLGVLAQGPSLVPATDTLPSASLFRPTPSHVILMSPVPAAAGGSSLDPAPSAQSGSPDDPAPQLVEYSDAYFTRLTIHRWASYLTVPLFASQYIVGQKLMNGDRNLRGVHGVLAASVAGLFAVNTITGGLNLIEARKDPEGRTRRTLHSVLMLLADAGFVATGATAGESEDGYYRGPTNINRHRNIALVSMGTALVSYAIMLPIFGRD